VERWVKVLLMSLGGAAGVNARYWLGVWMSRRVSPQFPWATFCINVTGSFAIGLLTILLAQWLPHPNVRLLLIVGFLGGYTTFSSYSYETLTLAERGEWLLALLYSAGSVVLGLVAVVLGVAIGRGLRFGS
jgi:CrcB protein